MHVFVCMHVCVYAWDTPLHMYSYSHPHPPICHPPEGTPRIGQNLITLELIKILFEDLKSVENSPPMGKCMVWWLGGWVMGGMRSNH